LNCKEREIGIERERERVCEKKKKKESRVKEVEAV